MQRYLLVYEQWDGLAYEEYSGASDCAKHIVGLDKGVLWQEKEGYSAKEDRWEMLAAFTEHDIKLNRDLKAIPADIIAALF